MASVIVRYEIRVNQRIDENYRVYKDVAEAKRDIDFNMRNNAAIERADIAPITERVSRLGEMPIMVEAN